jgi:RHS repeat-associated protein
MDFNKTAFAPGVMRMAGTFLCLAASGIADETVLVQTENILYTEYRKGTRYHGFNPFTNNTSGGTGLIKKYSKLSWSGSIKESNTTNYPGTQRTDFTGTVEYPELTYPGPDGQPVAYTGPTAVNTLKRREFRNLGDPASEGDGSGGPYIIQGYPGGGCGPLNTQNLLTEFPGAIGTMMSVPTQIQVISATERRYTGDMGLLWSKIHLPCNLITFQTGSTLYQSTGPTAEILSGEPKGVPVAETVTRGYFPNATAGYFSRMENNAAWSALSTTPVIVDEVSYDCVLQFRPEGSDACAGRSYVVVVNIEKWQGTGAHTFEEQRIDVPAQPSATGLTEIEATVKLKVDQPGQFAKIASAILEVDGVVCSSCGVDPGATGGKVGSIDWAMDLGLVPGGTSAGRLQLRSETWSSALYTPAALRLTLPVVRHPASGTVLRADGSLRQVRTGTYLVDVITATEDNSVAASGYEIRFYSQSGSTPTVENPALHAPAGDPQYVTRLQDPDGNGTRLTIRRYAGSSTLPVRSLEYGYAAATNTWSLIEGDLRRTERSISALSATEEQVLTSIWELAGGTEIKASELREKYRRYTLAGRVHRVMYERTLDPAGLALTTAWTYVVDTRGMLRMTQIDRPDGTWEKNEFSVSVNATSGEATRIYNTYAPFVNSGPTASSSQQRRFVDAEVPDTDSDGDGKRETIGQRYRLMGNIYWGERVKRLTKPVTFDGQICHVTETARLYGPSFSPTASDIRWERQYTYATGPFAGRAAYIRRPDQTLETISYVLEAGTGRVTETRSVGAMNATQTAVINGERTVTITDVNGRLESTRTTDIVSGLMLRQETVLDRDDYGRPTVTSLTDGSLEERSYNPCCGLLESVTAHGLTTTYTYDELGRQTSETSKGITMVYTYDALDRRIRTTRRGSDGSEMVISQVEYDPAGRIKSQTDAGNRVTLFAETYNADRTTTRTTTNPDLGTVIEVVNADGSLATRSGTATSAITRTYAMGFSNGGMGFSLFATEYKGSAGPASLEWVKTHTDGDGRVLVTETPDYGWADNYYDGIGRVTNVVDADGISTLFAYNARGEQDIVALDFHDSGSIDLAGQDRVTRTSRVIAERDGVTVSRVTTETWESNGQNTPTVVSVVEQSIDGLRSWQTVRGQTSSSVAAYNGAGGRTVTTTAPDGTVTTQIFAQDRLQSATVSHPSLGTFQATTFAYDAHGRLESSTDARNGTTQYSYFADGQVHTVTTPDPDPARSGPGYDPQTTTFGYDAGGRQNQVIHPDGAVVTTEFFPTGAVRKVSGARTYPVEYTYDDSGRIKTLKTWRDHANDAGAAVTTWNYDPKHGWLENKRYADGQGPGYTYTLAGRLATRTWARGIVTTYGYDSMGDLRTVDYSDATPDVAFTFDRLGRPLTRTDAAGTCTWAYHANGQLDTEIYSGGLLAGLSLDRDFDSLSRLSGVSALSSQPSALSSVTYGYDAASRLSSVTTGPNTATYGYLPNSSLVGSVIFKQSGTTRLTTTKVYDNLNRLSSISSAPSASSVLNHVYSYNSANQRTKATREDNSYWNYSYDALGQVTSSRKHLSDASPVNGLDYAWTYDDIGNRKTATANSQLTIYTPTLLNTYSARTVPGAIDLFGAADTTATVTVSVDIGSPQNVARQGEWFFKQIGVNNASSAQNPSLKITGVKNLVGPNGEDAVAEVTRNAYVPQSPEAFTHDADGNLTDDARWHYTWDGENRLIAMETAVGAIDPNGPLPASAKRKLEFAYDGQGRRISKKVYSWDGSAWVLASSPVFFYDGWNLIAELNALSANSVARTYVWGLDLSGSLQGAGGVGGLLFASSPAPSSLLHAPCFDGNGNVIGLVEMSSGTKSAIYEYNAFGETIISDGVAAASNPFRFSTKYSDTETGLLYYGQRYNDAVAGRWINKDPIAETGGHNVYALVANDPLNEIDVLGQKAYMVYRQLNITGLKWTSPITGHVYLAFDDEGMGSAWQQTKASENLGSNAVITMSFHPYSVYAELNGAMNDKDRISTFITDGSYVQVNDRDHDIKMFYGGGQKRLVTSTECEQIKLFKIAVASMKLNNGGIPDPGRYSFADINCAFWARTMIQRSELSMPAGATWNLGTGLGTGIDNLGAGRTLTYAGRTTVDVVDFIRNFEFKKFLKGFLPGGK